MTRKTDNLIRLPQATKDLLIALSRAYQLSLSQTVERLIEEKRSDFNQSNIGLEQQEYVINAVIARRVGSQNE